MKLKFSNINLKNLLKVAFTIFAIVCCSFSCSVNPPDEDPDNDEGVEDTTNPGDENESIEPPHEDETPDKEEDAPNLDELRQHYSYKIFENLEKTEMINVEGGTFVMGAQWSNREDPNYDPDAFNDEHPLHNVTLSDFSIGKFEVTQALWEYVMGYEGKCADGSDMKAWSTLWIGSTPIKKAANSPAYNVSYKHIVDYFIPRLCVITGKYYRLPTEAEWEYAARSGNKSEGMTYSGNYMYNLVHEVAWYFYNSDYEVHEVGTLEPNLLGIYDMSGNVDEWCSDWYANYTSADEWNPVGPWKGEARVIRGGNYSSQDVECRVSARSYFDPKEYRESLGFRLVGELVSE